MTKAERVELTRAAYLSVFCGENSLRPSVMGQRVLLDLRKFCRMDANGLVVTPSTHTDPYATVYAAALRDVYLRVSHFINLDQLTEETKRDRQHHAEQ